MKRVTQPVRKNLLDVIKENLHGAGRATYVTRVVYIGEYDGAPHDLEKKMETVIKDLKADYVSVFVSGFLLVYPKYYIHVLEAAEDTIYEHFKNLYNNKTEDCKLRKSMFLPFSHHVQQRFFTEWFHMDTVPPTLIEKPDSYEQAEIQAQITYCLTKIYTLCDTISNTVRDSSVPMKNVVQNITDKNLRLLPESTVLEYLLSVDIPPILTIEKFLETYARVPLIHLYADTIWPPPRDFMFHAPFVKDHYRNVVRVSIKAIRASRLEQH